MRRGEIRVVDLEPARGSEANKQRPAVVVSNDAANNRATELKRGLITILPLTSKTQRIYPFQVLLPGSATGLQRDSKAQAEQIRCVDFGRLGRKIGSVPPPLLQQINEAIRIHLAL
jgi:mRNA interferase MazF